MHVGESRSGKFWAVIKARDDGQLYFAYGRCFLSYPDVPKIGHDVIFTPLPASASGPLDRATEIQVKRPPGGGSIKVGRDNDTRLALRSAGRERVLGEIQI